MAGSPTQRSGRVTATGRRGAPGLTGRYTAPVPRPRRQAVWVPTLMFTLLGLALLIELLNYAGILPGGTSAWYGVGGGVLMVGGLLVATRWR